MPPPPAHAAPAPSAAPPRSARTKVILGVVVAALVAGFVALKWKSWEYQHWANAADKPGFRKKIQGAGAVPALDERLLDTVKDDGKATSVRIACASLLIDRNRLREVEDLLRDGSPRTQRVVLAALAERAWFHKQYLQDPSFPIAKILLDWIGDKDASGADRARALDGLLHRVWPYPQKGVESTIPPEILKTAAGLLTSTAGDDRDSPDLRKAAAKIVVAYRYCAGVPALLEAARKETDPETRLRLMQRATDLHDADGSPCKDVLSEADVFALVEAALAHPGADSVNRSVRMGALAALQKHRPWAVKKSAEVRRVLESDADSAERGDAMRALVASADRQAIGDIAVWLHDRAPNVRSAAVQAVAGGHGGLEPTDHLSLLVGYFFREPAATDIAFQAAAVRLRTVAGSWIGFPEGEATQSGAATGDMSTILREVLAGKTVGGKTRADVGAAWWNWLAGKNGVEGAESLKAAFAARDAFWAKAEAGDLSGARAALEAAPAKDSPLWEYERGFLAAKAKRP